jgi:glycosyltransferase involved in cell wall biosynthesis
MKILIFSFYFPPDLSAGSFRAESLVEALAHDVDVELITSQPNRYAQHVVEAPAFEQRGRLRIHRIPVPAHRGGMALQIRTFAMFAKGALALARTLDFDVVVGTSSRLFTATLAARVAAARRKPLYLDIRDIFVDTMKDVLGGWRFRLAAPMLGLIERYTMSRASIINLVSPGFLPYFQARYPTKRYHDFTNGIDPLFLTTQSSEMQSRPARERLRIVYAGNIGEGQGLDQILPTAATALKNEAEFIIYGGGGRLEALRRACADSGVTNVQLRDPVARPELLAAYRDADALFVHLNDYPAFLKVIPSKLFEYGATGRPLLAGLGGTSAGFVRSELPDAALFAPLDASALVAAVRALPTAPASYDRTAFIDKYLRSRISRRLADEIIALGSASAP